MKSTSIPVKSVRRTSSVQKIKPSKAGAAKEKAAKPRSWTNIMDLCRARISLSARDLDCNEVRLRNMSPSFAATFGLDTELLNSDEQVYRPLSTLFGKSTYREFPFIVESTLLAGQTIMEYVNFYRSDGEVLSCHVTIRSIPSGDEARQEMQERQKSDERWAVMAVRSASSLGNANFCGVGLLGVERIPLAQLERVIGGEGNDVPEIDMLLSSNASSSGASC